MFPMVQWSMKGENGDARVRNSDLGVWPGWDVGR